MYADVGESLWLKHGKKQVVTCPSDFLLRSGNYSVLVIVFMTGKESANVIAEIDPATGKLIQVINGGDRRLYNMRWENLSALSSHSAHSSVLEC